MESLEHCPFCGVPVVTDALRRCMRCRNRLDPPPPPSTPKEESDEWRALCRELTADRGKWTALVADGVACQARPSAHSLISPLPLAGLLTGGGGLPARVLKESSGRRVILVMPEVEVQCSLILKHYVRWGAKERFAAAFGAGKPDRERRMSAILSGCGVPVPPMLAWGRLDGRRGLRGAFTITLAIPDAVSLKEYAMWRLVDRGLHKVVRDRKHVARLLARLVSKLHAAGYRHSDLHASNVLVQQCADELPDLWLIDVDEAFRPTMDAQQRADETLAMLWQSLSPAGPGTSEILRFMKEYLGSDYRSQARDSLHRIERVALRTSTREYDSRTRKCMGESPFTAGYKASGLKVIRARDVPEEMVTRAIDAHDRCVKSDRTVGVTILKQSHTDRVSLYRPDGAPFGICIKQCTPEDFVKRVVRALRFSRARRAWKGFQGLFHRRIPAALPVALAEPLNPLSKRPSYLLTREVDGGILLDYFCRQNLDVKDAAGSARRVRQRLAAALARRLAALLRTLSRTRTYHGDLKASNLMVQQCNARTGDQKGVRLVLLDAESVRFNTAVTHRRLVKNLAQLNASISLECTASDRLGFLKRLLGRGADWDARKRLAREVLKDTGMRNPVWTREESERPGPVFVPGNHDE